MATDCRVLAAAFSASRRSRADSCAATMRRVMVLQRVCGLDEPREAEISHL